MGHAVKHNQQSSTFPAEIGSNQIPVSASNLAGLWQFFICHRPQQAQKVPDVRQTKRSIKGERKSSNGHRSTRRWSGRVTKTSDALDLEDHVFARRSPSAIAQSLKRSAEQSKRRKSSPFRSAMSMLTFYVNRAGKNLSEKQRHNLDRAKSELRKIFGREK
ncbi:MAG: DUF3175 domain-containing protein [Proteobacteria bacterium]|nr:DUF3175 domain-containing protein [Pseudomonadota bacterium]